MKIPLIKKSFYNEEKTKDKLCVFIKRAKKLSMGAQCREAEEKLAEYSDRKYCKLFNSGSSADLVMVQAYLNMGVLKKGDGVGFSALTWATNVMPLIQLGLKPVPIDIDVETLNVSSEKLEKCIKQHHIKALFLTNALGFCGDIDKIKKVCRERKILFFEDNCESFGSKYKNVLLGNFGDASSCSFFVGHHLSTIEGGCVLTDNYELNKMLALVREHGWNRGLSPKEKEELHKTHGIKPDLYQKYVFYDLAYNLRPTEITGFLLKENLRYADEIIKRRQSNFLDIYEYIQEKMTGEIYPLDFSNLTTLSNFAVPIVCKSAKMYKNLVDKFTEKQIEIRPIISGNILRQPFFKKYGFTYNLNDYPNAEIVHELGFYFGNNPDMTEKELAYIKNIFK